MYSYPYSKSLYNSDAQRLPRIGMRTMVVGPARMGQEIRCPQSCVRLDASQYAHVDWQLRLSTGL